MTTMTPMQRMSAVLTGDRPDHPPVSFWHHFPIDKACGQAAVDAHLHYLKRYDLDFVKIMNDNPYPWKLTGYSPGDLRSLPMRSGTEEGFAEQLELIRSLTAELKGKVLTTTTVFNSWMVLRRTLRTERRTRHDPPKLHGGPTPADVRLSELLAEDRFAVQTALDTIAESLAGFARQCIEAGADGIFLSVRDDWVNTDVHGLETYDELVRPGDLKILDAVRDARFNILHVCGIPQCFDAFADYPVHVINWADRAAGPAIRDVVSRVRPVVCGGVDNLRTLPGGTPEDVEREVHDALNQAGGRPMIVSAGCTFDPDAVPSANLEAMVRAACES